MGTFHDNLGELHGITVVVETRDHVVVGRCHEANDRFVLLHDADVHASTDPAQREAYIRKAAKWGVFPNHKSLRLDRADVTTITRLGEIAAK